jgi:hypothetical protein
MRVCTGMAGGPPERKVLQVSIAIGCCGNGRRYCSRVGEGCFRAVGLPP